MKQIDPNTPILSTPYKLVDFWRWTLGNIMDNVTRGVFAEFLVGAALDVLDQPRIEWDAYDLMYGDTKIEVKSSAFIQNWKQENLSTPSFIIKRAKGWNAKTNKSLATAQRSADIYVFCLFATINESEANVLDLSQWEFYVLSTPFINEHLGSQKKISLNPLRKLCEPLGQPLVYGDVRKTIDTMIADSIGN